MGFDYAYFDQDYFNNERFSETLILTDIYSRLANLHTLFSEIIVLTETKNSHISITRSELIEIYDLIGKAINKNISDNLILTDIYSRLANLHVIFTDALILSDGEVNDYVRILTEAINLIDDYLKTWALSRTYSDNLTLLGIINKGIIKSPFLDTILLSDTEDYIHILYKLLQEIINFDEEYLQVLLSKDLMLSLEEIKSDLLSLENAAPGIVFAD